MGENQNQFISLYEGHCYRQAGPTTTPCVEMALRMLDSDFLMIQSCLLSDKVKLTKKFP